MNTYEFWNDIDKIYNAIVAYQEKNIEFNKQFINPWVKLGNSFDKNISNEEIMAQKNAIEIDPKNAQNWYELANLYTRFGDFEKSIQSYQKTIELGFESGELYKNLALAYTMAAKYEDSIPFFQKAFEMLETNREKATVLNHLGNVFRKLDNYELALQAFQKADQIETGKTPTIDELPAVPVQREFTESLVEGMAKEEGNTSLSTEELATVGGSDSAHKNATLVEDDETDNDMQVVLEFDFSSGAINEETESATFEEIAVAESMDSAKEDGKRISMESVDEQESSAVERPGTESQATLDLSKGSVNVVDANDADKEVETFQESNAYPTLSAYGEYLEDNDPVGVGLAERASDIHQTNTMPSSDADVTNSEVNMEASTNLDYEMDSKNAQVWNELGNVYFNANSFDDAIAAYKKAVELDPQFAWAYTNLALSYVKKGQLTDAISLYQRGIELFSNEKDKAIAWNRLGNVYRHMNDYENAITAYQRADELDPSNNALTQQSRFSLLGSEKVEQEAEYSA